MKARNSKFWIFFILLFAQIHSFCQDSLTIEQFTSIVLEHHPIAQIANNSVNYGEAQLMKAKGGFDPKVYADVRQKYMSGDNYYSYIHPGLKIPTWFGVEAELGYSENKGDYLSSESYTAYGLWNAGLKIQLGKGLFIDQRRADLQIAQIVNNSSMVEKELYLRQLKREAKLAYIDWMISYQKLIFVKSLLTKAEDRNQQIVALAISGEKAAIDTLKSSIQVGEIRLIYENALLENVNKRAFLNTFLWGDGFFPLELDEAVVPVALSLNLPFDPIVNMNEIVENHPEIILLKNEIDISSVEYRLKRENLKPEMELKYHTLSYMNEPQWQDNLSIENYAWSASFSYPILTRKERGETQMSAIKLENKELKMEDSKAKVKYYITKSFNELVSFKEQSLIQENVTNNYYNLLNAEQLLFNSGESDLFLVNTREIQYLTAMTKLLEAQKKFHGASVGFEYHTVNVR